MQLLLKVYNSDWQHKCERSLYLAKQLGNIYTGSLYNGLLTLICDDQIDLTDKNVAMFSYGSGCAASLFRLTFTKDYKRVRHISDFKKRLESRMKLSPEQYDQLMAHRESIFGVNDYTPTGTIEHFFDGTFYLTKIDKMFRRYYQIKGSDK
jgi:hydroxymethylglutaryl-CoA synthase